MGKLLGFATNDADRLRAALYGARAALSAPAGRSGAWGVGFYQAGEVLLQKRPRPPAGAVDLFTLLGSLRTDLVLAQVLAPEDRPADAEPRNEDTPPYRFRSWLWLDDGPALSADAAHALKESSDALPPFLRRNIRGAQDGEKLFHMFLDELRTRGGLDRDVGPGSVSAAMAAALVRLDAAVGGSPPRAVLLADGQHLVGVSRGVPLWLYEGRGASGFPEELDDPARRGRPGSYEHMRSAAVISDAADVPATPGLRPLPDRSVIVVSHAVEVDVRPL